MQTWLPLLAQYGLVLVFLGAILEGETIIILAGVLAHRGVLPYSWVVAFAALGAVAGDQLWFHLGRRFGPGALTRMPWLARHVDRVQPWLTRNADRAAAGSRFVYGTRIATPVLLGARKYPPQRFLIINSVAGSLWAILAVTAGYLVGAGAEKLLGKVVRLEQLLLAVLIAMIAWWLFRRRAQSKKESTTL